jgi:FMN phosphatase YigB (HAD superfamily)
METPAIAVLHRPRGGNRSGAINRNFPGSRGQFDLAAWQSGAHEDWRTNPGRLLGLDDEGLLAKDLEDLRPRPEIIDLTRRAREKGINVAALSNSWGTGDYDPYAGWDLDDLFDAVVIS